MSSAQSGLKRRAERALQRQLDYQRRKAAALKGRESEAADSMQKRSLDVRRQLQSIKPVSDDARVIEIGCGSTGLIYHFGTRDGVGVDPLADHYRELFPAWQKNVRIIAAPGESVPFDDSSFDVVLCDNVVDHAENPRRIVEEAARILAPGGLFYFTVNVHHPFYRSAATLHAGWRAVGIPIEIRPFADHTVHLTHSGARNLFDGLPLTLVTERFEKSEPPVGQAAPIRWLQHLFFKNALYTRIMIRAAE